MLVGTPVANRTRPETEGMVGCFINTLVMRGDLSGDPTFRELLARTRSVAIDAQSHQDLPFELMIDALEVKRSANRSPLFQAMLIAGDGLTIRPELDGLTVSAFPFKFDVAKFDLTLNVRTTPTGVRAGVEVQRRPLHARLCAATGGGLRVARERGGRGSRPASVGDSSRRRPAPTAWCTVRRKCPYREFSLER